MGQSDQFVQAFLQTIFPLEKSVISNKIICVSNRPPSVRDYAPWLERWWLSLSPGGPERLEGAVQSLSDRFTVARPNRFSDYFSDPLALAAYGNFFFPQSWVRARLTVAELLELRGWRPKPTLRILDVGAGLGACGVGAAMLLRERGGVQNAYLNILDYSLTALEQCSRLIKDNAKDLPGISLEHAFAREIPLFLKKEAAQSGPYDLIIAGFALNEIWHQDNAEQRVALIRQMAQALTPEGILLVIEPAQKETALALQEVSDLISQQGFLYRWGPYAGEFPCPLRERKKYWAHEVRAWDPPAALCRINRRLWREIGELKFHWAAWSKTAPIPFPETPVAVRLCTPFAKLKGHFEWAGVTPKGLLVRCELPLRGLSRETISRLGKTERGDTLFLSKYETLEENRWRIGPNDIVRSYPLH